MLGDTAIATELAQEPPAELEIFGAIDGFRLSGLINGWAVQRLGADYITGLHVELRRGEAVLLQEFIAGPRLDVTHDEMVDAAFSLDFSGLATVQEMLDSAVVVVAVDGEGRVQPLGIFEPILLKAVEDHATDMRHKADARAAAAATAPDALARTPSPPGPLYAARAPTPLHTRRRSASRPPRAAASPPDRASCFSAPAAPCSPATCSATS